LLFERGQHPAEISGVEAEPASKDTDFRALRSNFPQHARLAERARPSKELVVERTDAFGHNAIEAADALNRREIHDI
jgi:alanine racemase